MEHAEVLGVKVAFVALEVIALAEAFGDHAAGGRGFQEGVRSDLGRSAAAHVGEDEPAHLDARVGGVLDLFIEGAAGGLAGLLEAAAVGIVEPAVVDATEAAVFESSIAEIGATVRAMKGQEGWGAIALA